MRLLLDSHVFFWATDRPREIPPDTSRMVVDAENDVFVSAASIWELSIKHRLGKLTLTRPWDEWIEIALREGGFQTIDVTAEHGAAAGQLPMHHRDPFDRMLVAQALLEDLTIVTRDRIIPLYHVPILQA
jgi:PIN domain nuclease of toxin-antitoxin system